MGARTIPLEPGNIDLEARPTVVHPDGSISTVYSEGRTDTDGHVVNYPTVADEGRMMTSDEAWQQYKTTGKHLGKFKDVKSANRAAVALHEQQANAYGGKFEGIPGYDVGFGVPEISRGQNMKSERAALAKQLLNKKQGHGTKLPIVKERPPEIQMPTIQNYKNIHPEVLQHVHDYLDTFKKGLNRNGR